MAMERLLKTKDVAEMLNCDRSTVTRMVLDGRLKGFRIGRSYRFFLKDVETFLEKMEVRESA
jgi:excisionase family DNA binding protein